MLSPRERRYLTLYLPLGIVVAIMVDAAAFAAIGGPFPGFGEVCAGCPSSTTPLGTAFALGAPLETASTADHWYNFTVQSAGSGLDWVQMEFQVLTSTGAIEPSSPSWSLVILASSGLLLGGYSLATGGWTGAAATAVVSSQTVALDTGGTNITGEGAYLNVLGQGAFEGTISVAIP